MQTEPRPVSQIQTSALFSPTLAPAVLTAVLTTLLALPAAAQLAPDRAGERTSSRAVAAVATPSCAGGIVYDNGTFENGVRFTNITTGGGLEADVVMRFELPGNPVQVDQVCLCWLRNEQAPANLDHGIVFFAADGPGGEPGTELAVIDTSASGIGLDPAIFSYDVAGLVPQTSATEIYVGARFNGRGGDPVNGIFLCTDDDRDVPGEPMYAKVANETSWLSFDDPELFGSEDPEDKPDALGVRIDVTELVVPCPQTPCVSDDTTACLNDDRFAVSAGFDPPNDADDLLAPAHRIELTDDTAYFWFFNQNNVELVVKVLDACVPEFDRFWVFAGGLTNVEVRLEVCDTEAGIQRTYTNPQGATYQPIQDTNAFATCP